MKNLTTEDTEGTEVITHETDIGLLTLCCRFERERNEVRDELLKFKGSYSEFSQNVRRNKSIANEYIEKLNQEVENLKAELKEWQTLRLYGENPEEIHAYIKRVRYEEEAK